MKTQNKYALYDFSARSMPLRCCGDACDCTVRTSAFCNLFFFLGGGGGAVRTLLWYDRDLSEYGQEIPQYRTLQTSDPVLMFIGSECRPTHDTVGKSHRTITVKSHYEDKVGLKKPALSLPNQEKCRTPRCAADVGTGIETFTNAKTLR